MGGTLLIQWTAWNLKWRLSNFWRKFLGVETLKVPPPRPVKYA